MDLEETTRRPPGQINPSFNMDNERIPCENLDELTSTWTYMERPSFVTVLLRFFGNIVVDVFKALFS